uniref:HNF-1_N domain-containing protein n=1 Tax=Loa loa TaxID=7209 RepID=A0A1I7VYN5_LOALO
MNLFTVEQLELIRRLRLTGITPEAVIEAFRALEQIEADLDAARIQTAALAALIAPATKMFHFDDGANTFELSSPILLQHLRNQAPVPVTINASSSPSLPTTSPDRCAIHNSLPLSTTTSATTPTGANDAATSAVATAAAPIPPTCLLGQYNFEGSSPSNCRPIRSQRTPMREITTLDDPSELDEFMQQGEEACILDMKKFITQFSLRQTTVAMMTGVSQPYISKLLNGNHRELSLRCRKNIYSWYLNCRRHPEKLSSFLADPSTRLETNGDGELIPQRRERYVFRPILIRILEGVGLMPKEVVSPQVVANWFANKRKELRRRSNDECNEANNANLSQVSSPDAISSPSPTASMSNTPMETDRLGLDDRIVGSVATSVPISVPAVRPGNSPIEVETSLFPSLAHQQQTTLVQTLMNPNNFCPKPDPESPVSAALPIASTNYINIDDTGRDSVDPAAQQSQHSSDGSASGQCLAEMQCQLDLVNNSVLALVNPYNNQIHNSVMKVEQTAE